MKKKFKDTKFAKIAGSILKGALLDTTLPLAGVVKGAANGLKEGIVKVKQDNLLDQTGGQGKPNYLRWASLAIFVILMALFILGVIDESTFDKLLKIVEKSYLTV